MNTVFALQHLMPYADYATQIIDNTEEEYDKIEWNDERDKPSWEEVVAAWEEIKDDAEGISENQLLVGFIDKLNAKYSGLDLSANEPLEMAKEKMIHAGVTFEEVGVLLILAEKGGRL